MAARLRHALLRRDIVATAARMDALGINRGTSGNVSARTPEGLLITPTGVPCDALRAADVVAMRLDGTAEGPLLPSSEWRFHVAILKARPEIGAVVHAHPPFCTTLAVLHMPIPSFHYMVAKAGGADIRCAPYATFGTQALSDHALAALEGRKACLLANHGMIAAGPDLRAALDLAMEVEALAEQYWRALQVGRPKLLPATEMRRVVAKFATYGRQPGRG
ncbi:MAG: class II aldolase/adducin family protein [Rhodospirillales bacterium]